MNKSNPNMKKSVSPSPTPMGLRLFVSIVCVVVAGVIGIGLYLSGSPAVERERRLDDQRTQRLNSLSYTIDEYYREEKQLPMTLDDISNSRTYFEKVNTLDPATNIPFDYQTTASTTYQLCATFTTDNQTEESLAARPYGVPDFWRHSIGYTCFPVTVRGINDLKP